MGGCRMKYQTPRVEVKVSEISFFLYTLILNMSCMVLQY